MAHRAAGGVHADFYATPVVPPCLSPAMFPVPPPSGFPDCRITRGRGEGWGMLRALVVDDHPGIAQAVAAMVRSSGCEAAVVHSGEAAMDFLRTHRVDLVVLDVSMPGMSGLEVLREMGAEGMLPGTPVLMFSASEEHRERSLMLGATGFVLKHEADDLAERIGRLLRCPGTPTDSHDRPDAPSPDMRR